MKKTILLLLTSVSCVLVSACYTTPEMNENKYKLSYEDGLAVCKAQTDYQHEGLRNCIERAIAYDDAHKKTVTIIPTEQGTLVVPKAYDDEDMMDTSRVYEVVGGENVNVVVEEGAAPNTEVTQTTITITEIEKEKTDEATQEIIEEAQEDQDVSDETNEEIVIDEVVQDNQEEVAPSNETTELLDETIEAEILQQQEEPAEVEKEEPVQEATDIEENALTQETANVSGQNGQTVTFVVGPLKEDLVVSVKPAAEQTTAVAEKKEEKKVIQKTKTISTYQKSEKEVLPIEEK